MSTDERDNERDDDEYEYEYVYERDDENEYVYDHGSAGTWVLGVGAALLGPATPNPWRPALPAGCIIHRAERARTDRSEAH